MTAEENPCLVVHSEEAVMTTKDALSRHLSMLAVARLVLQPDGKPWSRVGFVKSPHIRGT